MELTPGYCKHKDGKYIPMIISTDKNGVKSPLILHDWFDNEDDAIMYAEKTILDDGSGDIWNK